MSKFLQSKADLDPFLVVLGVLQGGRSDQLVRVMLTAGLRFTIPVPKNDEFNTARLRALVPRIQQTYEAIDDQTKLVLARAVIAELRRVDLESFSRSTEALKCIGWEVCDGELVAAKPDLREMFFPKGSPWDAFVVLRELFAQAQTLLTVIDPYCDGTVFKILSGGNLSNLRVRILCSRQAGTLAAEARAFEGQNPGVAIEVRQTTDFHDRFVVVDDQSCVHIGASLKDAGKKAFMVSRVEDNLNRVALLKAIIETWDAAVPVT